MLEDVQIITLIAQGKVISIFMSECLEKEKNYTQDNNIDNNYNRKQ